ncbi:MBL fold metallo-hydrolase [Thiopseudomonas acetoxidans]|uniref:MBL fold metallo-hydrolase n=1 Tax=Thiopseudomonas acetoxidans TaxID=3041622 RepID=A0ABT7SN48_9GAMM|nr:MBL fold metallo-hydrolase [Thiopseudomonas sp. CY1220]MDM7857419.1 MBL fold metallo-hydrolase [Thiopseudomonas sp. CY1220]
MASSYLQVEGFFDPDTWTLSYLVLDSQTNACAIIDSVLDYDPKSGRTSTQSADKIIARVQELGAQVQWILETHVHADHLSAAPYLQQVLGGKLAIGSRITQVQDTFGKLFNLDSEFARDGSQFDRLLVDGDVLMIGGLKLIAMHTPGHTPACMTYVVSDASQQVAFVGDTLFMPDYGTARCDFPGGDARTLYQSINKIFSLPDDTMLYMCHDYQPDGRELRYISSVAEQRANNIHVHQGVTENEFVQLRETRDATLDMPVLILPSVQINMRAGHFPQPEDNGIAYLKIPLNSL